MKLELNEQQIEWFNERLNSISLFMTAHPECFDGSEMDDRLDDVEEMISFIREYSKPK